MDMQNQFPPLEEGRTTHGNRESVQSLTVKRRTGYMSEPERLLAQELESASGRDRPSLLSSAAAAQEWSILG